MIIANDKTEGFNNKLFNNNKTNGFTIIEVVLVLAIAGLIFLVVFLALPALQKSQRDDAKRQDVAKVIAGLQSYYADNGTMPGAGLYSTGYFGGLAQASATRIAIIQTGLTCGGALVSDFDSYVNVRVSCTCDAVNANSAADVSNRQAAVHVRLESGALYCRQI